MAFRGDFIGFARGMGGKIESGLNQTLKYKKAQDGGRAAAAVAGFKRTGMGRMVTKHPVASAMVALPMAGGISSGRRSAGLDKVIGRPTGIFEY